MTSEPESNEGERRMLLLEDLNSYLQIVPTYTFLVRQVTDVDDDEVLLSVLRC